MKNSYFLLWILFPFLTYGQAHIGSTLIEIESMHPEKYFETGYTKEGNKYIMTDFAFGTFVYYFNNETGLSDLCIQTPSSLPNLNTQIEIYNKKYVIVTNTSWRAYLEGGGIMYIKLVYDEEFKLHVFYYSYTE